jgi:predicted lysophospholipase L1 biosynthesis ABC-type transport system permease subunit
MDRIAETVSETVDFRSMVIVDPDGEPERALTQVRGVDGAYPLYGEVVLDPPMPLSDALSTEALPGIVMQRLLVDRLALSVGETVRLGTQDFELRAVLETEPDGAAGGFALGPRSIVRLDALEASGLLAPGTLFDTQYRLALPATLQTSSHWRPRPRGCSPTPACAGEMRATVRRACRSSSTGSGRFWCWSASPGSLSEGSEYRRLYGRIWMARSPPSRR